MEEQLERCSGLDVHRDSVVASIMVGHGKATYKETRTFGTMTDDLEALGQWLKEHEIIHVAIESTGVYWKPVFNVLEKDFSVTLANARHVKNVPGRKTDVKDSMWLCQLLKHGLVKRSFIPPPSIRRLRELTRYRSTLTKALTAEKNRLIKYFEARNYKLSTVFSDVFGKTAWKIILLIIAGETDVEVLTANIPKSVKAPRHLIKKALKGTIQIEDLKLLNLQIKHIRDIEQDIATIEGHIREALAPYAQEVALLKTIPGISDIGAAVTIAEIGNDMNQFETAENLTSWAGLCPGNNESAGKKKALA